MEALGMAFRQAPKPCCSSSSRSDLVGLCRLDPVEDMRTGLLRWGSGPDVDPFPWPCVVRRRSPLAARNWKGTALSPCAQSSNENRKLSGLKIVCCCQSELQDTCCLVVVNFSWKNSDLNKFNMVFGSFFPGIRVGQHICILKLSFRGVKSFNSECMLCILEARLANEQAGDGDPRSFGLIRRWKVRKPLLLIPRYDGRERFILGSVKRSQDLQPNVSNLLCICPLDCWESCWRLARTFEAC